MESISTLGHHCLGKRLLSAQTLSGEIPTYHDMCTHEQITFKFKYKYKFRFSNIGVENVF